MEPVSLFLVSATTYLLGSIPSAYIVGRVIKGVDIRRVGSHNVGALNTLHTVGPAAASIVLVADTLKGTLAILISLTIGEAPWACLYGAIGVTAGHNWPIFLGFRGGKGAATILGVSLVVLPWLTLASLALAAGVAIVTRHVVVAAAVGFVLLNSLTVATGQDFSQILLCLLLTAIVTATYLGRSWHQTLAAVRHGRLADLFSFE